MESQTHPNPLTGQFWLGVNYWPRQRGVAIWQDWHPDEIDAEFGEMTALGLNVARIFLRWEDFQPIREYRGYHLVGEPLLRTLAGDDTQDENVNPDLVDDVMIERLAVVCGLAAKHHLRLMVAIFVGWMSGVSFEPPFLRDRNMFTDPTLLRYQVALCRRLANRFCDDPAILAWDLGNEQNCFQPAPSVDAAWHWTRLLTSTLRLHDPNHAVISGMHSLGTTRQAGQHRADGRFLIRDVAEHCDCLTVHPYPDFVPVTLDPPLDPRGSFIASWQLRLYAGLGRVPVMAQEFGTLGDGCMSREVAAAYTRRTLYSLLGNGSIGAVWWCHTDFTVADRMPYRTNLMEYDGLGMHDTAGQVKPVGRVFADFAATLAQLDTAHLAPLPAQAAIILPWLHEDNEEIFNAFVLARRAGLAVDIVSPDDPLSGYQLLIVPCAADHSHFTQPQWERIRARTAAGATLYVSSAGASLPGLNDMAGIELQYRRGVTGARLASIVAERPGLPAGFVLCWMGDTPKAPLVAPTEGVVIAVNAAGDPFIVEHGWQNGRVIWVGEPVERYLCGKSGLSVTDETWRIYRYLRDAAGIVAPVQSEQPNVECGLLQEGDQLLAVLTNHSAAPISASLTLAPPFTHLTRLDGQVFPATDGVCTVELAANAGMILRIR